MEDTSRAPATRAPIHFPVSLRTRLILANVAIVAVSIVSLGYYVFYRGQQASEYLSQQLDSSIRQKAVDNLNGAGVSHANEINNLFVEYRQNLTNVAQTASMMLSSESELGTGTYWNASQSMARLENGSWDNAAPSDPASVFLPAREELTEPLATELNTLKELDLVVPNILHANPDLLAMYFGGPSGEIVHYPNAHLAERVPSDYDVTNQPWYVAAAPEQNPHSNVVWSAPYLNSGGNGLVVTGSLPVYDSEHRFRGVVAMDIQLNRIRSLITAIRAGVTGYGFVIDKDGRLIAMPYAGYRDLGLTSDHMPLGQTIEQDTLPKPFSVAFLGIIARMKSGQSGLETLTMNDQQRYIAFRPISELGYNLAIVVPTEEMLSTATAAKQELSLSATNTQQISFVLMAIILGCALLATMWVVNTLIAPLLSLTDTAEEIAGGNLDARARVKGEDEIATLAGILNTMTTRLRELIQSLERRVKDRTAALEVASHTAGRRAALFEAVTQVTRAIASIRNMDELMPLVAAVISQYFGFYHVGIFLNDETNEYAWLIAANSEGGRRMLQRRHNLKIGEQGIVGYVAAHGETRVARSVGRDAVFFSNPDLPETKSEAAIPLRRGLEVAGVLDVQSTQEDAFSDEDLGILAILADQVGLAMENTRLFEETRRSLLEAETLYRQFVQEAWNRLPQEGQLTGYRYSPRGAAPLSATSGPMSRDGTSGGNASPPLVVPIKLRGETIGNLVVQSQRAASWSQDQIELVQAVADRVAFSAENARLFDETTRRAERERLVTEITARIRSSNDPDEMIRTAVEELRNALGATEIQVIPQTVQPSAQNQAPLVTSVLPEAHETNQRGNGAKR